MPRRPLNECRACRYTWHPRGHNVSSRCPQCGSSDVQISMFTLPLLGCLLALVMMGCCGVVGLIGSVFNTKAERPVAKSSEEADKENNGSGPKSDPNSAVKAKSVGKPNLKANAVLPLPGLVTTEIAIAPPPRLIPLNRPPAVTPLAWVQRGGVRIRLLGATVVVPKLTDDSRREFLAPAPALLVWVETESLTTVGISLRRWQNPLKDFVMLTGSDDRRIKPAKFPTGSWVGGQLEGGHSLPPGGSSVVDVLAFEVPASAVRNLYLTLDASPVVETGSFFHTIPYDYWSKK
jgi:hypothetical protein